MNYLAVHGLSDPVSYDANRLTTLGDLSCNQSFPNIDLNVLLTEAGYLTIKQVALNGTVKLGYPNNKVASSLAQLHASTMLGGVPFYSQSDTSLMQLLRDGSLEALVEHFNAMFNCLDYHRYQVTDKAQC